LLAGLKVSWRGGDFAVYQDVPKPGDKNFWRSFHHNLNDF
jgi:hypothetical protein